MLQQQKERLNYHIKERSDRLRHKLNLHTKEEKEFLAEPYVVDPDMDAFVASIMNALESDVDFDPKKTILFCGHHGHRCNFLTAQKYRNEVVRYAMVSLMNRIDTFFVNYSSPFGLIALEKLLEMREKKYSFRLYAIQGGSITRRKTYRLIPETNAEILQMGIRCDEHFSPDFGANTIRKVYRDALRICDEDGISINPLAILKE